MRIIPPEFRTEIGYKYLFNLFLGLLFFAIGAYIFIMTFGADIFVAVVFTVFGIFEVNKHSLWTIRRKTRRSGALTEVKNENSP